MRWKNKLILSFFLWAIILLAVSPLSLNEKPWFSVPAILLSFGIVFGWNKLYPAIKNRFHRS